MLCDNIIAHFLLQMFIVVLYAHYFIYDKERSFECKLEYQALWKQRPHVPKRNKVY